MNLLAVATTTHGPSHGMQGFIFMLALVAFLAAVIVAWVTPPLLNRAVALLGVGLLLCALVWMWVQYATP